MFTMYNVICQGEKKLQLKNRILKVVCVMYYIIVRVQGQNVQSEKAILTKKTPIMEELNARVRSIVRETKIEAY